MNRAFNSILLAILFTILGCSQEEVTAPDEVKGMLIKAKDGSLYFAACIQYNSANAETDRLQGCKLEPHAPSTVRGSHGYYPSPWYYQAPWGYPSPWEYPAYSSYWVMDPQGWNPNYFYPWLGWGDPGYSYFGYTDPGAYAAYAPTFCNDLCLDREHYGRCNRRCINDIDLPWPYSL